MKNKKRKLNKKKLKEFIINSILMLLLSGTFGLLLAYGLLHATTLN